MQKADLPSPQVLPRLFMDRARRSPERIASYSKIDGRWVGTTWRESEAAVTEIALGLLVLGARAGTPVAILSETRREWGQVDMAILAIGAVTVGIYPSLTGAQTRQLLELSGARIVVVDEAAQATKVVAACAGLSPSVKLVTMTEVPGQMTLAALRALGARRQKENPDEIALRIAERKVEEVVTYVYTSGTTGEPKGAMLTHANFHYVVHATSLLIPYTGERALVFLPLAHSLQRYGAYLGLVTDVEAYYAESLAKVRENLLEVQPSVFALVPRVLEKIHAKALAAVNARSGTEQRIFHRSMAVLQRMGAARRDGRVAGLGDRVLSRLADRWVGQRIREGMGGRVKFIGSGGAPLNRQVHEFFEDIGIPILEGYGLTETCAPVCLNTLEHRRIGTVGRPLLGTEVKLADDGEIMVRGPGVFAGYFGNQSATESAFKDGWFLTGDVGQMSRDGFLTITDRKKDLIITAGGKNVAPQPLEQALARHPWLGQAVVIGDRRPYLVALLGFDPELVGQLREKFEISSTSEIEALAAHPEVKAELDRHLARVDAERPSFEQIKRWAILPNELTIESGDLTPTLKVKRRVVGERHQARIEQLYA